jgi:hypothetical protein
VWPPARLIGIQSGTGNEESSVSHHDTAKKPAAKKPAAKKPAAKKAAPKKK